MQKLPSVTTPTSRGRTTHRPPPETHCWDISARRALKDLAACRRRNASRVEVVLSAGLFVGSKASPQWFPRYLPDLAAGQQIVQTRRRGNVLAVQGIDWIEIIGARPKPCYRSEEALSLLASWIATPDEADAVHATD
jgi:hypothetical protein